jgi:hypothetical protein
MAKTCRWTVTARFMSYAVMIPGCAPHPQHTRGKPPKACPFCKAKTSSGRQTLKYEIRAIYKVEKLLEVEVAKGDDPKDPANWKEIESEHDADCYLHDVIGATPTGNGGE